jgi:hypothetical protein
LSLGPRRRARRPRAPCLYPCIVLCYTRPVLGERFSLGRAAASSCPPPTTPPNQVYLGLLVVQAATRGSLSFNVRALGWSTWHLCANNPAPCACKNTINTPSYICALQQRFPLPPVHCQLLPLSCGSGVDGDGQCDDGGFKRARQDTGISVQETVVSYRAQPRAFTPTLVAYLGSNYPYYYVYYYRPYPYPSSNAYAILHIS